MAELRVYRSKIFKKWREGLTTKEKRIVDARIEVAREFGLLRKFKAIDKDYSLFEFKWDRGLRVYFSLLKDVNGDFVLLLTGGNKNSQNHDIVEARNILLKALKGMSLKGNQNE